MCAVNGCTTPEYYGNRGDGYVLLRGNDDVDTDGLANIALALVPRTFS